MQEPKPFGGITPDRAIALMDALAANATGTRIDHLNWQNAIKCVVGMNNDVAQLTAENAELKSKLAKAEKQIGLLQSPPEPEDTVVDGEPPDLDGRVEEG